MSKRHVTDFWALVVFVVILISMVIIVTFSIINSHPGRMFGPSNSNGEVCGEQDGKKVNLAIFDYSSVSIIKSILSMYNQRQIILSAKSFCVETCPPWVGKPTVLQHFCPTLDSVVDEDALAAGIQSGKCAPFNIPTFNWNHYCLPDFKKLKGTEYSYRDLLGSMKLQSFYDFFNLPTFLLQVQFLTDLVSDFEQIKWWILFYVLICYIITLAVIMLIGFGTFPVFCVLYICGVGVTTTALTLSAVSYYRDADIADTLKSIEWIKKHFEIESIIDLKFRSSVLLIIILSLLEFIVLVFGFYLCNTVYVCAKYAKKVGKTTRFLILTSVVNLLTVVVQLALVCFWIYISLCIMTSDKNKYTFFKKDSKGNIIIGDVCQTDGSNGPSSGCVFGGFALSTINKFMWIYFSCGALWILIFVNSATIYIISYSYYKCFVGDKPKIFVDIFMIQHFRGIKTLIIYNVGSVIVASAVVTMAVLVNILFWLFRKTMGFKKNSTNFAMKVVQKILIVLKYLASKLQKMAIIETVVSKGNFVKSVKRSLEVTINHPVLSMVLTVFKVFTRVFGCLISSALSTAVTYVHVKYFFYGIKQPIIFSCVMCLIHLVISYSILEIYTIGLSTYHYFIYHHRQDKLQMMERRASIDSGA